MCKSAHRIQAPTDQGTAVADPVLVLLTYIGANNSKMHACFRSLITLLTRPCPIQPGLRRPGRRAQLVAAQPQQPKEQPRALRQRRVVHEALRVGQRQRQHLDGLARVPARARMEPRPGSGWPRPHPSHRGHAPCAGCQGSPLAS